VGGLFFCVFGVLGACLSAIGVIEMGSLGVIFGVFGVFWGGFGGFWGVICLFFVCFGNVFCVLCVWGVCMCVCTFSLRSICHLLFSILRSIITCTSLGSWAPVQCHEPPSIVHQALCLSDLVP